jgi:hypothetical protein
VSGIYECKSIIKTVNIYQMTQFFSGQLYSNVRNSGFKLSMTKKPFHSLSARGAAKVSIHALGANVDSVIRYFTRCKLILGTKLKDRHSPVVSTYV